MADMKKGFDLASVLKNVSNPDTTGREQIEYIDIDLLDVDPLNFYEMSDIDALAENIELVGLQQPLRVRDNPDVPGHFMIVSGHRRRAAIQKLVDDGREDLRQVACIREAQATSPALQELRLLYANADTRRMTPAETSKQAERVEAVLYQLKEEGFDFPGRMRDHVAEVCKVSKTKLARLKVIRDRLTDEWQKAFEQGILNESVAYEIAQLPAEHQRAIFLYWRDHNKDIRHLYIDNVKVYKDRLEKLDQQVCSDGSECANKTAKREQAIRLDRYYFFGCGQKCCKDCSELVSCKYACPKLADKVKQLKEQRKEDRRNEKQLQEERERPVIEQLQKIWNNFGIARENADLSVKEFHEKLGIYHSSKDDGEFMQKECLEYKFTTATTLPYGYSCRLSEFKHLIQAAQLFGCSTDYLLGLSDQMVAGGERMDSSLQAPQNDTEIREAVWYSREVEPPVGVKIVVVTDEGWAENNRYAGGGYLDDEGITQWKGVRAWALMPGDDLIRHGFAVPPSPEGKAKAGGWRPGTQEPEETVDAVADFVHGDLKLRKFARWNGRNWQFPGGASIDAQCVRWYPLPEE